jgi:DNA-directed RNA polymerase specialized sigma subunit
MPTKKATKPSIDEIIRKTIHATRLDCAQTPNDTYKATERRLYAYPVIKEKVEHDKEMLERYVAGDKPSKSKSIVRFQKSGVRLSDEEILDVLIQDITAKIAANEYELETIDRAMKIIAGDQYVKVITGMYFEGKTVAEICEEIPCERSTVFRQKSRLVQKLSTFLYGVSAL